MKPVAIFRHSPTEGPGYFATFLELNHIPWTLIPIDDGASVPTDVRSFSGLAFMGGPMSVNDPLPWIPPVLALIRHAVHEGIPVIGHCLGGQLMSRALGGVVTLNAVKEIGWHDVTLTDHQEAHDWFGDNPVLPVFQWHGETFSVPPGGVLLAGSVHCANQAFALGKHLGLQCHIEMNRALVESWCGSGSREIAASGGPAVQTVSTMLNDLDARVAELNGLAGRVYRRWAKGLTLS
jgi:GMP synthase-like glutamine amidotransferase